MTKRDEINKKSIIIGITSVAIIAIAIITVIGIFTIKSHAQEKANEKVAVSLLKKSEGKTQKQEYKLTKNADNEKYDKVSVEKAVKNDLAKVVFKNAKNEAAKDQGKVVSKVDVAKVKDEHKVGLPQSVTKVDKLALHKAAYKLMKGVV